MNWTTIYFLTVGLLAAGAIAVFVTIAIGLSAISVSFYRAKKSNDKERLIGLMKRSLIVLGVVAVLGTVFFFMGNFQIK